MSKAIRVVIATDIRLYREGLERLLKGRATLDVVGTAADGVEVMRSVDELQPDVLLLDPAMPDAAPLARSLYRADCDVRIVVLGLAKVEVEVVEWAERGIHGFVTRENSAEQLVAAIEAAFEKGCICSPRVASALLRGLARRPARSGYLASSTHLTTREYEVGHLVRHGLSNKLIAHSLNISVATVKNHVHNILTKLELSRRGEVAAWIHTNAAPKPPRLPLAVRSRTRLSRRHSD